MVQLEIELLPTLKWHTVEYNSRVASTVKWKADESNSKSLSAYKQRVLEGRDLITSAKIHLHWCFVETLLFRMSSASHALAVRDLLFDIADLPHLTEVYLSAETPSERCTDEDFAALLQLFPRKIVTLCVSGDCVIDGNLKCFLSALQGQCNLTKMEISGFSFSKIPRSKGIRSKGIVGFVNTIASLPKIKSMLYKNAAPRTKHNAQPYKPSLTKALTRLANSSTLVDLDFSNWSYELRPTHVIPMLQSLKTGSSVLRQLDISGCERFMTSSENIFFSATGDMLRTNSSLKRLVLPFPVYARCFLNALGVNSSLEILVFKAEISCSWKTKSVDRDFLSPLCEALEHQNYTLRNVVFPPSCLVDTQRIGHNKLMDKVELYLKLNRAGRASLKHVKRSRVEGKGAPQKRRRLDRLAKSRKK